VDALPVSHVDALPVSHELGINTCCSKLSHELLQDETLSQESLGHDHCDAQHVSMYFMGV
jgi:hypothetical protein